MNERRITPEKLSEATGFSKDRIGKGIKGEVIPLTLDCVRKCVLCFGLISGRTEDQNKTTEHMSYDDCINLISPPSSMPRGDIDFWQRDI